MPDIELLTSDQWPELQDLRLAALKDSPDAFLATYNDEAARDQGRWQAEFDRGQWYRCHTAGQSIGLLGATKSSDIQPYERYIEYLWVSPRFRRAGIAMNMLRTVLKSLREESGVRTAYLWVLDGNDIAVRLYERAGFVSTNHRQPIRARPGRTEERMVLALA